MQLLTFVAATSFKPPKLTCPLFLGTEMSALGPH